MKTLKNKKTTLLLALTVMHVEGDTTNIQLVTCNTCHRGAPKPFGKPLQAPPQSVGAKMLAPVGN